MIPDDKPVYWKELKHVIKVMKQIKDYEAMTSKIEELEARIQKLEDKSNKEG